MNIMVENLILKDFGTRLKEERRRLKLSQEELAKLGGVSRASQYLYEQGSRAPNIEYLMRLARGGADSFFLITGKKDESAPRNGVIGKDVLSETLRLIADHAVMNRGNSMLEPSNLISLVQLLISKIEGRETSDVDWQALRRQIDGWLA